MLLGFYVIKFMYVDDIIIAIKDAPIFKSKVGERQAYKLGDKFKIVSYFSKEEIIIWHPLIESTMAVNAKNFETLEQYRQKQINKII